jgi:tetratricopeptide (TPR) repeat protein
MSTSIQSSRRIRPDALAAIETRPADAAALQACRRASLLDQLGRTDDARALFLAGLAATPDDATLLNGLGELLYRTGYHSAARTTYHRTVTCHPSEPIGHVNLANLLREAGDLAAARRHYEIALDIDPDLPEAHQGLGNVLAECGRPVEAGHHWQLGYRDRVLNTWSYRGPGQPVRILMLISVANGNIPVRVFLDDRLFAVTTVAMEFYTPALVLPPHDLVLNAIGDADLCGAALHAALDLLNRTAAPVINPPGAVLQTDRAANALRLRDIQGVIAPRCILLPKQQLAGADAERVLAGHGLGFPLLLRAPGFHTGRHFTRVDQAADLPTAVAALPGDALLAIEYLNATGADGRSRKGRVMIIDGQLYPLHWAISQDWKVHYFTAGMAERREHRQEEARFLADMAGFLGAPAVAALAAVARCLGLDYGGIDFAVGEDGRVLLFEANASMAIVPPPADQVWNYRRNAIDRVLLAAKGLLMGRARRGT